MKPWEPRPKESTPAYAAFAEYRDMGETRSIDAVQQKVNKNRRLIARWSGRWSWVERVREYDAYLDGLKRAAREKEVAKQARKIMSADEVREELSSIASTDWREFVEVKMADGSIVKAELKLNDKIKSLELMGKNHALFTEKHEHKLENAVQPFVQLIIESIRE